MSVRPSAHLSVGLPATPVEVHRGQLGRGGVGHVDVQRLGLANVGRAVLGQGQKGRKSVPPGLPGGGAGERLARRRRLWGRGLPGQLRPQSPPTLQPGMEACGAPPPAVPFGCPAPPRREPLASDPEIRVRVVPRGREALRVEVRSHVQHHALLDLPDCLVQFLHVLGRGKRRSSSGQAAMILKALR